MQNTQQTKHKKIGIFGGSFNPIHNEAVAMCLYVKNEFNLDKIIVIPTANAPHKPNLTNDKHRLEMVRWAFLGVEGVEISTLEIDSQTTSYTADTLTKLKGQYKNDQLYYILGSDSAKSLKHWHKPEVILNLATLIVVNRADANNEINEADLTDLNTEILLSKQNPKANTKVNTKAETKANTKPSILTSKYKGTNISSTKVRAFLNLGLEPTTPPTNFIPQTVMDYITENNLYADYLDISQKVKQRLSADKFLHTAYTVACALELNAQTNLDPHKVFLSALLHDVAKQQAPEFNINSAADYKDKTAHADMGAKVASEVFGVTDTDILDAIRYHTTGRAGMQPLEKLIYVADKVEQTRDYPLNKHIRKTAYTNIDEAVKLIVKDQLKVLKQRAQPINPLSQQLYDSVFSNL
ncbi:MAG: nicotinate (nicotinamide) nucleotide adenylyltransferase [Firmicutes bacterium]|nr:nicotinate (nicotinamide) nucleotide adenylyltransferase [Bacillota bacterium]